MLISSRSFFPLESRAASEFTLHNLKSFQRYLCCICGYRFSQSIVEVDIAGKVIESLDSGENDHEVGVASGDTFKKKVDNCLPFVLGEDITSHDVSIVEKCLYGFPLYNGSYFYNSNSAVHILMQKRCDAQRDN